MDQDLRKGTRRSPPLVQDHRRQSGHDQNQARVYHVPIKIVRAHGLN